MAAVPSNFSRRQRSRLLLATTNRHKIEEFRELLRGVPCEVVEPAQVGLDLDVPETGSTFMQNATIKARAWAIAAGIPTIADDSGLEIDALGGEPGLYSARWAGPDVSYPERFKRILARLTGVPQEQRTARYRCALVVAAPDEAVLVATEGTVEGHIAAAPRGTGGFGYDPLFELPDGRTFGEMTSAEKHWISHRGRAVAAAIPRLEQMCALSPFASPST
jgi:XTP/dITP diphosphohydrolase